MRLAVEITSPDSVRIDRDLKSVEDYAQAGIPAYWIIDLVDPVLRGETGTVRVEKPVALELDLDVLPLTRSRPRRDPHPAIRATRRLIAGAATWWADA